MSETERCMRCREDICEHVVELIYVREKERDDARAALAKAELENVATKEHAVELWRRQVEAWQVEHDQLLAHLATARAVAMEEAARNLEGEHQPNCFDKPTPTGGTTTDSFGPCCGRCSYARQIRALAPLPSTLVAVDRKTLEEVRATLEDEHGSDNHEPECGLCAARIALDAALGAGK